MASEAVTRVDVPTQSRTTRIAFRHVELVGPTPLPTMVRRELVRLAEACGAEQRGWVASWDGYVWTAKAYVGRPGSVVAVAERGDLRTVVAALLGELMAVST